jgi:hypothetical protein
MTMFDSANLIWKKKSCIKKCGGSIPLCALKLLFLEKSDMFIASS